MYAKLKNGVVVSVQGMPNWFTNDGVPIEDDALFIRDGIYPVVDTPPQYNFRIERCVQKTMDHWIINSDCVEITYAVSSLTIAQSKEKIRELINKKRYEKIYQASIPYMFPDDSILDGIQMRDEIDRQNIQDIVMDANFKDPSSIMYFMPVSNNIKTMTAQEIIAMGIYVKNRGDSIVGYCWSLKQEVEIAMNLQELAALDIDNNWPY